MLAVALGVAIRTGRTGGTEIIQEMAALVARGHLEAAADPGEQVRVAEEQDLTPADMEVVVAVAAVHMVRRAVPAVTVAQALPVSS